MGQLIRYSDITPHDKFQEVVDAFKTYVTPVKLKDLAAKYINGTHGSNAMLTCLNSLEKALIENDTQKIIITL